MTREEAWLLEEKYAGTHSAAFAADCKRLASGEPLAYVIGWQPFLGLRIHLDSHPLIPRPETEWWTEQLLADLGAKHPSEKSANAKETRENTFEEVPQGDGPRPSKFSAENYASPKMDPLASLKILDLCAGSGAIGCALLSRFPDAEVYFGEINPTHEVTILKNIHANHLDAHEGFRKPFMGVGDLFAPFAGETFDLIVCNPPYIPSTCTLDESVTCHEPALALYSGKDGLDILRRIASELAGFLAPGGVAWIEVDAPAALAAAELFRERGFRVEIRTDQYERPRVLVVSFL